MSPKGKAAMISVEKAIERTIERFPFEGYMSTATEPRSAHMNIANVVLGHLEAGATIFDFGCGPCDKTAILQLLGYRCSGFDPLEDNWHTLPGNRENILRFADECGIDFRLADGGDLPFERESFDMVMMNDVLEHLHDSPRDLLNDLLELCKPEGLLLVTVPNAVNVRKRLDVLFGRTNLPRFDGYYWYPGCWKGHVREYVRDDLVKLAGFLDLEILELRGCDHMLEKLPKAAIPIYLLATKFLDGLKDSWMLLARKRPNWKARKAIPADELNDVLGKSTSFQY